MSFKKNGKAVSLGLVNLLAKQAEQNKPEKKPVKKDVPPKQDR